MNTPSLGIDMAKLSFTAALWFNRQRVLKADFDNRPDGFRKLCTWCRAHGAGGALRVAIESTSTYAEPLLEWLQAKGHAVHLLNAERVAHYARACGQRNATDRADAATIAAFIATHEATPWTPPAPEQKDLRSLTRARAQIVGCAKSIALQAQTAAEPARQHLQNLLSATRRELAAIDSAIVRHLKAHPQLAQQVRRLMTLKGIGRLTAAILVAELPPITDQTDPRAIAAWAGLTPRRAQSGPREWTTRISRKGNAYLRQALYMPALVAKRYNPLLRQFAERLAAAGKTAPQILGAIAHKMLRILVGLLRSNTDFDPNWSAQKN